MNSRQLSLNFLVGLAGLALTGCTYKVGYNPSYLPGPAGLQPIDGTAAVMISQEDEDSRFAGKPTSFTGSGTTLEVPTGLIVREIALSVFGEVFREGVKLERRLPEEHQYRAIITPHLGYIRYAYNQAKNLGFAITPQVELRLEVSVLDPSGNEILRREYSSGLIDGETYMINLSPQEAINKTIHITLHNLMIQAAEEVSATILRFNPQSQPHAPSLSLLYR